MIGGWTDVYEKAKSCGFNLTVVQRKEDIKPEDMKVVDQMISSPLGDKVVVDLVAAIHEKYPFDAVVSFQEFGVLNAALIKERLGIMGNPLAPVLLTRDKIRMREHLQASGIASIPFARVTSPAEVIDFARTCGWPIIIKPANGVGSLQVHKLFSEGEVEAAFHSIKRDAVTVDVIKHDFPEIGVIAEKFIDGPEVSVEAVSWGGQHTVLGVTDKLTSGHPNFVETGHSMPSALPEETIAAIKHLTATFLVSIGHKCGPSHTEVIVSEQGPIIVESHTRTGGDRIFEMTELAYGVDMIDATLKGLFGTFPDVTVHKTTGAAIRYLSLPAGRVSSIDGVEAAKASPGLVRCDIVVGVGDKTKTSEHSAERPGYVLAVGDNGPSAIDNAMLALSKIKIELVPV
jgi:biotin carboxylase